MKSYHVFTLSVGKAEVERIHIPEDDLSREEATEKLLDMITEPAKRASTIAQRRRASKERIVGYRIARPTRFHRENAERLGQSFPTPVGRHARRRAA